VMDGCVIVRCTITIVMVMVISSSDYGWRVSGVTG
jgi:hypothetical protein